MSCDNKGKLTLGEGTTEKLLMILSGYSSQILEMREFPFRIPFLLRGSE